ncbi:MAG: hypothetical protein HY763_08480 [Planctomycetes bacterium]|nr:hypothetical protein [Planctomycetota bacterium]
MTPKQVFGRTMRGLVAALAGGMLAASSCETADVRAVIAGLDAAADQINDDENISFGEWVSSQLDDL